MILISRLEDVAAITHLDIAEAKHDVIISIIVPLIVMVISAIILYILSTKPVEQFILKKPENRLVDKIQFNIFKLKYLVAKKQPQTGSKLLKRKTCQVSKRTNLQSWFKGKY